jgi:ribosomal protein L31E
MTILGESEKVVSAEFKEERAESWSRSSPRALRFLKGFLLTHQQMKKISVAKLNTKKKTG